MVDAKYAHCLVADNPNFDELYKEKEKYVISSTCLKNIQNGLLAVKPAEKDLYDEPICICAIAKNENNYIRE